MPTRTAQWHPSIALGNNGSILVQQRTDGRIILNTVAEWALVGSVLERLSLPQGACALKKQDRQMVGGESEAQCLGQGHTAD